MQEQLCGNPGCHKPLSASRIHKTIVRSPLPRGIKAWTLRTDVRRFIAAEMNFLG
jgi:hypothetical protein